MRGVVATSFLCDKATAWRIANTFWLRDGCKPGHVSNEAVLPRLLRCLRSAVLLLLWLAMHSSVVQEAATLIEDEFPTFVAHAFQHAFRRRHFLAIVDGFVDATRVVGEIIPLRAVVAGTPLLAS